MKDFDDFKEKLKEVKNAHSDLKDEDFASKLGVQRQAISLILRGTTKDPGVSILYKMVNFMKVNPMWVFGFSTKMLFEDSEIPRFNADLKEENNRLKKEKDELLEELREVNKQNNEHKDELLKIYKELAKQNKSAPGKERLGNG